MEEGDREGFVPQSCTTKSVGRPTVKQQRLFLIVRLNVVSTTELATLMPGNLSLLDVAKYDIVLITPFTQVTKSKGSVRQHTFLAGVASQPWKLAVKAGGSFPGVTRVMGMVWLRPSVLATIFTYCFARSSPRSTSALLASDPIHRNTWRPKVCTLVNGQTLTKR